MTTKRSGLRGRYGEFEQDWQALSLYERFDQVVAHRASIIQVKPC